MTYGRNFTQSPAIGHYMFADCTFPVMEALDFIDAIFIPLPPATTMHIQTASYTFYNSSFPVLESIDFANVQSYINNGTNGCFFSTFKLATIPVIK
jgi:hypothetical protein